jgi:hypothetical protein
MSSSSTPSPEDTTVTVLAPEPEPERSYEDDPPHLNADESTPLLSHRTSDLENSDSSSDSDSRPRRSWWTITSIIVLLLLTLNIIVFAFVVPSATKTYAGQATTYTVQNFRVLEFTDDGMIASAKINVTTDSRRVTSGGIRRVGVFITAVFRSMSTQPSQVAVFLPQYEFMQVALVDLPAMTLDVRDHHENILDIVSNVTITDRDLAVQLTSDVLAGKRDEIEAVGETDVRLKAGAIPLGKHHVSQKFVIQGTR